ncbi:nucleotidyltransferase family protein [Candidatus Hakubella thermalkaliphila]|uniref:nucleotidyltransferase family protein n=1 Tax=Candidatus Hakubella thermalkaliphila TaxID=2754717 RepID=UPI0034DB0BF5
MLQRAAQRAFADYPVISAYLYGSQLRDRNLSTSDIDVAVYIDPDALPPIPGRRTRLMREAGGGKWAFQYRPSHSQRSPPRFPGRSLKARY